MEVTKNFEKVIEAFIEKEKKEDKLFAECVDSQPKKTIKGCVNYILKEVQKSKICGWTDEEIFGMAKHFYDEKELKDPGAVKAGRVVVNHHIDLSESEKEEAKQKAWEEFKRDERLKLEAEKRKADEKESLKKEIEKWEKKYAEKKGCYLPIEFDNGIVFCHVIKSVEEMLEEGERMHHCVFDREYYKKPESLILSARDKEGKRLETVEVSLKSFRVIQSRALQNGKTKLHENIVSLVEKNMFLIRNASKESKKKLA